MTLQLSVAQLNFTVGDMQGNARKIIDAARNATVRVTSAQPDAVVWNPWVAKSKARAQLDAAACFCSGLI